MLAAFLRLETRPGKQQKFVEFLTAEGRAVQETEPGTLRFDVFEDGDSHILLYEAFADEAAFEAHKEGDFYKQGHGPLRDECVENVEVVMRLRAAEWPP